MHMRRAGVRLGENLPLMTLVPKSDLIVFPMLTVIEALMTEAFFGPQNHLLIDSWSICLFLSTRTLATTCRSLWLDSITADRCHFRLYFAQSISNGLPFEEYLTGMTATYRGLSAHNHTQLHGRFTLYQCQHQSNLEIKELSFRSLLTTIGTFIFSVVCGPCVVSRGGCCGRFGFPDIWLAQAALIRPGTRPSLHLC